MHAGDMEPQWTIFSAVLVVTKYLWPEGHLCLSRQQPKNLLGDASNEGSQVKNGGLSGSVNSGSS